jgi:uncharacterized protein YegL
MSTTTDYAPPVDAPVSAVVPVCLLGDTSSSMAAGPGPVSPIAALNAGLSSLISTLQIHPEAADTAVVEIIEFSSTASVVMPYTHVDAAATRSLWLVAASRLSWPPTAPRSCIARRST